MRNKESKRQEDEIPFRVKLDFENEDAFHLTKLEFESVILNALESLHGQIGASIDFTISSYKSNSSVIHIKKKNVMKFWSSLSLFGHYQHLRCAFRVKEIPVT